jgi:hypothetical protein
MTDGSAAPPPPPRIKPEPGTIHVKSEFSAVKREGFDQKRVNAQLREFFTREPESEPKRAKVTPASAADKTRKQPHGCHKCSYRAAQLESLDEHVRYKHLSETMPHACDSGSHPPERGYERRFVKFFFFWFATGSFYSALYVLR